MSTIGVPCDSSRAMCTLRIWRCRSAFTCASCVSPSTPQFHEKLSLEPSLQCAPPPPPWSITGS